MVFADRQQTRVFALRTRIGLKRNRGKARDLRQPRLERLEKFLVAGGLIRRSKRMHAANRRPGDRDHLAGGV